MTEEDSPVQDRPAEPRVEAKVTETGLSFRLGDGEWNSYRLDREQSLRLARELLELHESLTDADRVVLAIQAVAKAVYASGNKQAASRGAAATMPRRR